MRLKSIYIKDYISIGEIFYEFTEKPLLIEGRNLTQDAQESNGSGKSAFIDAIFFAITGMSSRKVPNKKLIRYGEKSALIILKIEDTVEDEIFTIKREVTKSGTKLHLDINGDEEKIPFSTVNDGNAMILDWLSLTKEDIYNYYIINKESYKNFFTVSNTEKIKLITRLSNTEIIDKAIDKVNREKVVIAEDLQNAKYNLSELQGKIEAYNEQLELYKEDDTEEFKKWQERRINELKDDIFELQKDNEVQLTNSKSKETLISREIGKIKVLNYDIENLEKKIVDIKDLEEELKQLRKEGRQKADRKSELKTILSGAVTCPSCNFKFSIGVDINIEEVQKEHDKLEKEVNDIANKVYDLQDKIKVNDDIQSEIRAIRRRIGTIESNIDDLKIENKRILNKIEFNNEQIENLKENIEEVKEKKMEDNSKHVKELTDLILRTTKEITNVRFEITDLENDLNNKEKWEISFKRFKMFISNNTLKAIEAHTNDILEMLSVDFTIEINGFKYRADGSIKEEIGIMIVRDSAENFYSYSEGERARAEFALIIAIRNLINSKTKGLKFLAIDELFTGLDAVGLGKIMQSAEVFSEDILVVSHVSDERVVSEKLIIEKIKGVSILN